MADEFHGEDLLPSLAKPPALLPIAPYKRDVPYAIEKYRVTIVVSQPGSGTSTQLPQYLDQHTWTQNGSRIVLVQYSVTSTAARIADEMQCRLGDDVGYAVHFDDMTNAKTRIKVTTSRFLLREAAQDRLLSRYSVVVVDHAEERLIETDLLLSHLRQVVKQRPELRVVICTSFSQENDFEEFFASTIPGDDSEHQCRIVQIQTETHPVDILHLETPTEDYLVKAVQAVFDIHKSELPGDMVVFLTTRQEIGEAMQLIVDWNMNLPSHAPKVVPYALYPGLARDAQMQALQPSSDGVRRVVLTTAIAETTVAIDGIAYVVDTGFVRLPVYDLTSGIDRLMTTSVSKQSALYRTAVAGRSRHGKCFRLYTEDAYNNLADTTTPEIQRCNLGRAVLQLGALKVQNIIGHDLLSSPSDQAWERALDGLYTLGALDEYGRLSEPLGQRMAALPLAPEMAKALLSSAERAFFCVEEMLTIAAMSQVQESIWYDAGGESRRAMEQDRRRFSADEGDLLTLLNAYSGFVSLGNMAAQWCSQHHLNYRAMQQATKIRDELKRHLGRLGVEVVKEVDGRGSKATPTASSEQIRRCLTSGYFANAARMQPDGTFKTVSGQVVLHVHPSSVMLNRTADWVIYRELLETDTKAYIRDLTKVDRSWLIEFAPNFYKPR